MRFALAAGVVTLALLGLGLAGTLPSSWVPWYRIGSAAVLLPVGGWLAVRSRRRKAGRGWRARFVEPTLEILGVIMVAVGIIELVFGLRSVA